MPLNSGNYNLYFSSTVTTDAKVVEVKVGVVEVVVAARLRTALLESAKALAFPTSTPHP